MTLTLSKQESILLPFFKTVPTKKEVKTPDYEKKLNDTVNGILSTVNELFDTITKSNKYNDKKAAETLIFSLAAVTSLHKTKKEATNLGSTSSVLDKNIKEASDKCQALIDFIVLSFEINQAREEMKNVKALTADKAISLLKK